MTPLDPSALLSGARLLVVGGTGFLGKVWVSMLLFEFPEVEHLWLMVRPRGSQDAEARFWAEIAASKVFDPLRRKYPGEGFEAFIRSKITVIGGDVSFPYAGVGEELRDAMRGRMTALVNVAGVVDFNPPLDEALDVNAFGMQTLVKLARDLGDIPFLHTSTCYVAGDRTGQVDEVDPRVFPFPRAGSLDRSHWDAEREITECVATVEAERARSSEAFRQSAFLDTAKRNLLERSEPTRGTALVDEIRKVRRADEAARLVTAGVERAAFWGWSNIYTYTKALGELILAGSGLPFTICRPAVIESSMVYPETGWNEGINTSAPVIWLTIKGVSRIPAGEESVMDLIPVDMVSAGMILSLCELIEGTASPVYQYGSSDTNPCSMLRLIELTSLHKRKVWQKKSTGNPVVNWVQAHYGAVPFEAEAWAQTGPRAISRVASVVSKFMRSTAKNVEILQPVLDPAAKAIAAYGVQSERTAWILEQFVPFMATHNYRFSCAAIRNAHARLSDADKARLDWSPEKIDWRQYMLEIHIPGLERHVMPLIEAKADRPVRARKRHDTLRDFLDDLAERHDHAPALLSTHPDGFIRVSYRDLRLRAHAVAARLAAAGIKPGDRVLLSGHNSPEWAIVWLGIMLTGAVVVPMDPMMDEAGAARVAESSGARLGVFDTWAFFAAKLKLPKESIAALAASLGDGVEPPAHVPDPDDVVSVLFTSGTSGDPRGVMLTHRNFTSLLGSLAPLFTLGEDDRVLSVLPLHHSFEFTCGLLLPLAAGARVVYLDELTGERLGATLRDGRITAMVGVPALWQLLERRIQAQVAERGKPFSTAFDWGLELNRMLGKSTGLDLGRILFGTIHDRLGGNIRLLVSGGAALPRETHQFFAGLGLHVAEGYGLTEAAPVLTVERGRPGASAGTVGKPIPGVEIRISEPDSAGIGEVLARGDNVMQGYWSNQEATDAAVDGDGWLHTGDLGRINHAGKLLIVGRQKEVVVTASGENVYLDDVEARIGRIPGIKEYALVGIPDARGGERLGMLAVLEGHGPDALPRARGTLRDAVAELPNHSRPAVIEILDGDLPRTATRKVKRAQAAAMLVERLAGQERARDVGAISERVYRALLEATGRDALDIGAGTRLDADLGLDSMMANELAASLGVATEALSHCETAGDLDKLLQTAPAAAAAAPRERSRFPEPIAPLLKQAMGVVQREFHARALDVHITGRAFIPWDRPTIVVSNHSSHLDMGLVKTALGDYGENIRALAAKDYFFEGNDWWVAYFEQLTNLRPLDRNAGFRKSLEQAHAVVSTGHIVLLFPEGTRQADGALGSFKPLIGRLALDAGVDVLPLYIEGAYDILPRGATIPRGRKVTIHIGPPLSVDAMRRRTTGLRPSEQARAITHFVREAVVALKEGRVLDPAALDALPLPTSGRVPEDPFAKLFTELQGRFSAAQVARPLSWYWSLGTEDAGKWTVEVTTGACEIRRGRPAGGSADCVVKTSPEMFRRIVREGYVPDVSEFLGGTIKTNDPALMLEFAKVFQLGVSL